MIKNLIIAILLGIISGLILILVIQSKVISAMDKEEDKLYKENSKLKDDVSFWYNEFKAADEYYFAELQYNERYCKN